MKLKTLLFLEFYMPSRGSMGMGAMSSQDTKLRPMPGSIDDVDGWQGIVEGENWFLYKESNNWHIKQSGASVTITEGEPIRYSIKIKTNGLKKKGDSNKKLAERVRQHTDKVSKIWISAAKILHENPELNEIGNPIERSWSHCFKEALNDPKVATFVEDVAVDCINFTPRA